LTSTLILFSITCGVLARATSPYQAAAEREAAEAAALIARDYGRAGNSGEVTIEVREADGNRILIITVMLRIVRVIPHSG
jgi:hypothetical protein